MEERTKEKIGNYCGCLVVLVLFTSLIYFRNEIFDWIDVVKKFITEHLLWIVGIGAGCFVLFPFFAYIVDLIIEKIKDKKAKEFTYAVREKYPLAFEIFLKEESEEKIEDFNKWDFRCAKNKGIRWWVKKQDEEFERLRIENERKEFKSKYPFGFECWHDEHKYDKLVDLEHKDDIIEYDRLCIIKNNVNDFRVNLRKTKNEQFFVISDLRRTIKIYDKTVSADFNYEFLDKIKREDYSSSYNYVKQETTEEFSLNSYFLFPSDKLSMFIEEETEQKIYEVIKTLDEQIFDFFVYDSNELIEPIFLNFWKQLINTINNIELVDISSLDETMQKAVRSSKILYLSFFSSTEKENAFSSKFYNKHSTKYPCLSFFSIFENLSKLEEKSLVLTEYTQKTKKDYVEISEHLKKNNIKRLYHFTSINNVESIIKNGGLYSWFSAVDNGVRITNAGGGTTSRCQDMAHGVHDYVHLSFCMDHPMKYKLTQKLIYTVLVDVDPIVCYFEDTLFSDINAADKNCTFGNDMETLKLVDFSAVHSSFIRKTDPKFKKHQAEVMVPKFIPLKYITNLEDIKFLLEYYKSHEDEIIKRLKERCELY